MIKKAITFSTFFLWHGWLAYAQESQSLSVSQTFFEAKVGDTIRLLVKKVGIGDVKMKNPPHGARLATGGEFTWVVPKAYQTPKTTVEFYLYDSTQLVDIKAVFISISQASSPPKFYISCNQMLVNGVYELHPGQVLELFVLGYATEDSSKIMLDYFFDDHEKDIITDGKAKVEINDSQLIFHWTPEEVHLKQKYFSLTVNATDVKRQSARQVFLFTVTGKNMSPRFKFPILDQYLIHPNEPLEIDFTAVDPNHDSLIYTLDVPTSIGSPSLSEGNFYWKLTQSKIEQLKYQFPMEVTVTVTEKRSHATNRIKNTDTSSYEKGKETPNTISKTFIIKRGVKNDPPRILNLQSASVSEGLPFKRNIFIKDDNDDFNDLKIDILGAPDSMYWEGKDNYIELKWTPGYDEIGVEMNSKKIDMLLLVEDPQGSIDQKAFTLTVNHRENTAITYQVYQEYKQSSRFLIDHLTQLQDELEKREDKIKLLKKGLTITSMLFAAYTAAGNVFPKGSAAKAAVPYIGVMAVIASGVNAFGFNDLNKIISLREKIFILQQKLIYAMAILEGYHIKAPSSPNLESADFRKRLDQYEKSMVQDKINFKTYYNKYKSLNFALNQAKRQRKKATLRRQEPEGLLFLDMSQI